MAEPKEEVDARELKYKVKALERDGDDNLYGKFKPVRKPVRERNQNLEVHLSEELQALPNVSIQKFERNSFKKGL